MDLDLEHYEVPTPETANSRVYAANMTETPRFGIAGKTDGLESASHFSKVGGVTDRPANIKVVLVVLVPHL